MRLFRRLPPAVTVLVAVLALTASAAQAVPASQPVSAGMVDGPVRTIARAGSVVWVGGQFGQIQDAQGNLVQSVSALAAFDATTGAPAPIHLPLVTLVSGPSTVYDLSVAPDGTLYLAGNFDAVDGMPRWNVAAIDPVTGTLLPFAPHVESSMTVFAGPSAIYVGGLNLYALRRDASRLATWTVPQAWVSPTLRGHTTYANFRDIVQVGDTLVVACECDKVFDATHPAPDGVNVKAVVQIDSTSGAVSSWVPGNLQPGPSGSTTFGVSVVAHRDPISGARVVYLAAGGNDFTAAYDFQTGAQLWKTDTSGSSQAIAWYQGQLVVGGHFEWTESPVATACGDNAHPNPDCYHTPKLVAMDPGDGAVVLNNGVPWGPGVCCKYNGIWALTLGSDDAMLYVGGEFTKLGGTWQLTTPPDTWQLAGARTQRNYGRLPGPVAAAHALAVASVHIGAGTGTVVSDVGGIDCGTACDADLGAGAPVTLTAIPGAGYSFLGWGGDCSGLSATCTLTMSRARSVVALFGLASYPLVVSKTGAGSGKIVGDLGGLNCGSACSASLTTGSSVTLTATAVTGSVFTGWGGDCSGVEVTCVLSVDQAHTATAAFAPAKRLTVTPAGTGGGVVASTPAGIDCDPTCTLTFAVGTVVALTATPDVNSAFVGWSGSAATACAGTGPCVVTMSAQRTLTATFAPILHQLGVSRGGDGAGTVTSDVGGIACGATCGGTLQQGTAVSLTATAGPGSTFIGWTGDCAGTTPTCSVSMGGDRSVAATFEALYPLEVSATGSGGGRITGDAGGIDCASVCSTELASGATVGLTATADAGSRFDGWAGSCTGTAACTVTLDQARSVSATFTEVRHPLSMTLLGEGTGGVTSVPAAIDCGSTCAADVRQASTITLTATPTLGAAFTGWGGDCTGTGPCELTMDGPHAVSATFVPAYRLSASVNGAGGGVITDGDPNGIVCGAICSKGFIQGTSVILTATPDAGSVFTGWAGSCSGSAPTCTIAMAGDRAVTATFAPVFHALTIATTGDGTGSVASADGSIACGVTCAADLRRASTVTLTAAAGAGSVFAGWSGACGGTLPTCSVTMSGDESATAVFKARYLLTVATAGTGTVTGDGGAIDCGSTCADLYTSGDVVTLTAAAGADSTFAGWSGACTGSGPCIVHMDGARSATASFSPIQHVLSISVLGNGAVTSSPVGIACGVVCSTIFPQPTTVRLGTLASSGWFFTGWTGACSGTGPCQVTMDQARAVTASFSPASPCGRILFTTKRSGNVDIWVMGGNGTGQTRLTTAVGADIQAAWSPDCAHIAFVSGRTGNDQVYVMNADGTGITQLTFTAGSTEPTWSPDGTRILFVSDRAGGQKLFVMNADGSGAAQISPASSLADTHPDWSPDGSKIVFTSQRSGGNQVWVMNADGSNAVRLTKSLAACLDPAWSPDGARIAVVCRSSGTPQVWTVSPTGAGAQRVSFDGKNDAHPSWSPDGAKICYSATTTGAQQIWTVNATGGGAANVSGSTSKDTEPHWS